VIEANRPEALYERFQHQIEHTYPNRFQPGALRQLRAVDVTAGLNILSRVLWRVGARTDYRRIFWRMARPALKTGNIEAVIHVGLVAHHLIQFARDCETGIGERSFYAGKEMPLPSKPAHAIPPGS
jgi:hypothetical protein